MSEMSSLKVRWNAARQHFLIYFDRDKLEKQFILSAKQKSNLISIKYVGKV